MKFSLPTVLLNDNVLFPKGEIKLEFDNDFSKNIISESEFFHDNTLLLTYNLNKLEQAPKITDLSNVGIVAKIIHKIDLPNGKTRVILRGVNRAYIHEYLNFDCQDEMLESIVSIIPKSNININEEEILVKKLYKELEECVHTVPYIGNSFLTDISNNKSLDIVTDLIVPNLPLTYERLLDYLKTTESIHRFEMLLKDIYKEKEKFDIERNIDLKIQQGIEINQKQFLLREKIKALKEELGDNNLVNDDILSFTKALQEISAPDYVIKRLQEEIHKYENMENSFESSIIRNYIDYLLKLPWNKKTKDNDDLKVVMDKLNEKHFGIVEVKERIIEYLAVKKMSNCVNSPIICLVGPPGVGKTTLAYNVAESLGRKFIKISVGGVNDPAEIVGHRKTYLGAAPGRIIQGLKKCQSSNPVFLIDEIDKMGKDIKGDPINALLEVLDRTQNKHFSDNYIEEEYDLSDVMFIVTANKIQDISLALKDRLEIIYIDGYTEQEKLEIAQKHIIPNICLEYKLKCEYINFTDEALLKIIRFYTKEAGVRELERQISKIIRKIIKSVVINNLKVSSIKITEDNIERYLGTNSLNNITISEPTIGKAYSVAYTINGGDIFPIEIVYYKGNGNLLLTGTVGNELRESAIVALNYVRSYSDKFNIDIDDLLNNDIHINLPISEISKDGPSLGLVLATLIISTFKKLPIPNNITMTGELTLLGEVLEVGNINEKLETAIKNNIKTIFIPISLYNKIDKNLINKIEIIPVNNYIEIYERMYK